MIWTYGFLLSCGFLLHEVIAEHHVHQVACNSSTPVCECGSDYDVCEFNFTVDRMQTFTRYKVNPDTKVRSLLAHPWYIDNNGVWRAMPPGGPPGDRVCQTDDISLSDPTCTEPISVDGYTFRYVIAVNDRVPGPTLIVNQNQLVKVNVYNRLFTDTISIHWHGMRQENTNWMDGAGGITQCGIKPYSSFTYIFNATRYGSHWWHSHSGTQRTEGLYGALIVRQSNMEAYDSAKERIAEMTGLSQFQDKPGKHTLLFSDWFKRGMLEDLFPLTLTGLQNYVHLDRAPSPVVEPIIQQTVDGSAISFTPFWSGLINGKGRHESVNYTNTRLSIFTVAPNEVYRFRFIGAQTFYSYRISIDEHKLTVVATDGEWIEPVTVDYLILFSGERYDVLVNADQTSKNDFIIRAEILEVDLDSEERYLRDNLYAEAILHYDRADPPTSDQYESISINSDPVASRCTEESLCLTLNCPTTRLPDSYNATCLNVYQLKLLFPVSDDDVPNASDVTDADRLLLSFNIDGTRSSTSVNGRHFISPSRPFTMINDSEVPKYTENEFCKNLDDPRLCDLLDPGSTDCVCPHVRTISSGRSIQLVISNVGPVDLPFFKAHPIHFHGHSFHVVDMQYGEYGEDGVRISTTTDIECGGTASCTTPKWKNSDPYANLGKISRTAPLKDTIVVPGGGYAVVYFKSDNPGWWLMACHILDHFFSGMGVMIYETGDINPPPSGFPECGSYDITLSEFEEALAANNDTSTTTTPESSSAVPFVNVVLMMAMVLIFLNTVM